MNDEIEEDIVPEPEDEQPISAIDALVTSGAMSSVVGVDQSIESLNLKEFDYVEEVRNTPNGKREEDKQVIPQTGKEKQKQS